MLKRRTMPALSLAVNILPVLSLILARGATLTSEIHYRSPLRLRRFFAPRPAVQINRGLQRK